MRRFVSEMWMLIPICLVAFACVQQESGGSCITGREGCKCYESQSCYYGLECVEGLCVSKQGDTDDEIEEEEACIVGYEGCACFANGTCYDDLSCANGEICVALSGGDGDESSVTNSCLSDIECVELFGSSYVCNTMLGICEVDDPLAEYRCNSDDDCVAAFGAGWECPSSTNLCEQTETETDGDEETSEAVEMDEEDGETEETP